MVKSGLTLETKTIERDFTYNKDFIYKNKNPYHQKLEIFNQFVRRDHEGEELKGKWGENYFNNSHPLHVEIGSGYGHFMLQFCLDNPDINFIGMDQRFKRSFQLAKRLSNIKNKNFVYLRAKGERLSYLFATEEVSAIYYFFPDPWPKTRHHKKRLFTKKFLKDCYDILTKDGQVFIKTDHDQYFQWMIEVCQDQNYFHIEFQTQDLHRDYPDHALAKYKTKFEKIFLSQSKNINSLILKKQ